jgi:tripartite-type tricarboxylate transporter receptor subunit TctC
MELEYVRSSPRKRVFGSSSLQILRPWIAVAAAAGGALLPMLAQPAAAEDAGSFYSGKSMKLIVGLPPGGGADAYARLVQHHLPAHVPGSPSIIVQNMPGAGSLKSVMYLETLPDDGTAMGTFSSGLLTEALTSPSRVKVDFRKFAWLGNISEDVRVCYLWHTVGVKNWQDVLARQQVIFAASAAGTAGNAESTMLRDLFGVKVKQVQGYPGSAAKRLAVEKGEVDGDCAGWSSLPEDWVRDHKIDVFVRLSPTLLPGMDPKVPFAGDLVKDPNERQIFNFLMAPEKLGRLFMVSGKVPADRVALLQKGFDAMVADPAFLAEAKKLRLLVTPMTGAQVAHDIAALYNTPLELVARVKKIIGE